MNKFIVKCNNEIEFIAAQKYLFSKGFVWQDSKKKTVIQVDEFPVFILQSYKKEKLIIKSISNNSNLKMIDATKLLRKYKLEKLNKNKHN